MTSASSSVRPGKGAGTKLLAMARAGKGQRLTRHLSRLLRNLVRAPSSISMDVSATDGEVKSDEEAKRERRAAEEMRWFAESRGYHALLLATLECDDATMRRDMLRMLEDLGTRLRQREALAWLTWVDYDGLLRAAARLGRIEVVGRLLQRDGARLVECRALLGAWRRLHAELNAAHWCAMLPVGGECWTPHQDEWFRDQRHLALQSFLLDACAKLRNHPFFHPSLLVPAIPSRPHLSSLP